MARHLKLHPKRLQAFVEIIYDFSETQIGRASLPAKTYTTWFPYLATLFLFIWINNLISYLPLPVDTEHKIGARCRRRASTRRPRTSRSRSR